MSLKPLKQGTISLGDMDELIEVQNYTTHENDYKDQVKVWSVLYTLWADIRYMSSREAEAANRETNFTRVKMRTHFVDGLEYQKDYRIKWDGKYYDVLGIEKVKRRKYLIFNCELREGNES